MSVVCKCFFFGMFFFFKQKTAYEMRISDWSSDVCSSDLHGDDHREGGRERREADRGEERATPAVVGEDLGIPVERQTFRRKQQALLLVQRHAEDDDERRPEETRNQSHIDADGKSVLLGTSVSDRVVLARGRCIQTTQHQEQIT